MVAGRHTGQMPAVATPEVAGVRVGRHVLDQEAASLAHLARLFGRRCRRWLARMPLELPLTRDTDTGPVPVLDAAGNQVMQPVVPDRDVRETFELYTRAVLGLLREQRERAKLAGKPGSLAMDDATFEAELNQLARDTIATMPLSELRAQLEKRAALEVVAISEIPIADESTPSRTPTAVTSEESQSLLDFEIADLDKGDT